MDVSVLRLFAPFLMASLSTCSVSAESKIMPPAQGLWERNGEEKKKKKLSDTKFLLDSQLAISHIRLTEASFCVTNSHSYRLHSGTDS